MSLSNFFRTSKEYLSKFGHDPVQLSQKLQELGKQHDYNKAVKSFTKFAAEEELREFIIVAEIALTIASIYIGGATLGCLLLLGGSVALGSYDLYRTSKQYEFEKSASNTALDAAHELSAIEPSLLGLVLSIIGLGIDVGALSKMVTLGAKALKAGSMSTEAFLVLELQKTFANLTDLNKIDETAKELYITLGKANIPNKLSQKNFIIKVREIVLESREMTTNNDALLLLMKGTDLEKVAKNLLEGPLGFGLKWIYAHGPKVAEKLIKHFSKNLYVFERFCLEAALDKNFVDILGDLNKLLGSNWKIYNKTMKYLGSVARADGIKGLNDAISSLKALEKTTPELVSQILVNPKLRKVFYGLEDPEEIVVLWKQFKKEKPQSTFTEFVLNSTKQLNRGTAELRRGYKGLIVKYFHMHHVIPKIIAKEYADFFEKINFTK